MRAERLDPDIATTAFVKAERGGKVFVDSTRVGGATVIAAYNIGAQPEDVHILALDERDQAFEDVPALDAILRAEHVSALGESDRRQADLLWSVDERSGLARLRRPPPGRLAHRS